MTLNDGLEAQCRQAIADFRDGNISQEMLMERLDTYLAGPIIGYLTKMLSGRSYEDAEDIFQEVMIGLLRNHKNMDLKRPVVMPYVWSIVRSRAFDYLRRRANEPFSPLPDVEPSSPDERVSRIEQEMEVASVLNRLSPEEREVIVLTYWHNMTLKDISQTVGVPISTLADRRQRALEKMREMY